jgi:hypothetical protein
VKTLNSHLPETIAAYHLGASNPIAENINNQIPATIIKA